MSEITYAMGYLSGAVGIGFAVAFGMYAGIKAAFWAFGALNVNVGPINLTTRLHTDEQPHEGKP